MFSRRRYTKQKISSLVWKNIRAKLKESPRAKIVEQLKTGKITKPEQVWRGA